MLLPIRCFSLKASVRQPFPDSELASGWEARLRFQRNRSHVQNLGRYERVARIHLISAGLCAVGKCRGGQIQSISLLRRTISDGLGTA
jgi:hypothetical protein